MINAELLFSILALSIWLITALLPWQPWRVREVLEADSDYENFDLHDVTVVIPARDEAEVISGTLNALKKQGKGLNIIVVDDDSSDATASIVENAGLPGLKVILSKTLPSGWTGKLWAQEQGLAEVKTPRVLLLDADIELVPGMLKALKLKMTTENLQFVSLMAVLRFQSFWEKLLMPAFIYFFKMIYPFALANNPSSNMAAAAGGCILVEMQALKKIGGMKAIKDAVIDDCTLAKNIKKQGYRTWIGQTHGVLSQRPYVTLNEIWQMVARTAYTQLHYSLLLLLGCTFIMVLMYWWPVIALATQAGQWMVMMNLVSCLLMMILYWPTLNFYGLSIFWVLAMPIVAAFFLMMTWTSAFRYWRGERSRWKGRSYQKLSE